jgi:hypothetical protein
VAAMVGGGSHGRPTHKATSTCKRHAAVALAPQWGHSPRPPCAVAVCLWQPAWGQPGVARAVSSMADMCCGSHGGTCCGGRGGHMQRVAGKALCTAGAWQPGRPPRTHAGATAARRRGGAAARRHSCGAAAARLRRGRGAGRGGGPAAGAAGWAACSDGVQRRRAAAACGRRCLPTACELRRRRHCIGPGWQRTAKQRAPAAVSNIV